MNIKMTLTVEFFDNETLNCKNIERISEKPIYQ